jgi:hypothetical protein
MSPQAWPREMIAALFSCASMHMRMPLSGDLHRFTNAHFAAYI